MKSDKPSTGAKKVLLNSSFYIFSALLVDAIGFFLLPVYLIFLDAEEYGKVSIANGFTDVAVIIAVLSLHMAIAWFYADYKEDKEKVATYFASILLFTFATSVAFSGLCFAVRPLLERFVFSGILFYPVVFLVIISLPFRALRNIHRFILRGMQSGGELALTNLIAFVLQAGLTLLMIGPMKMGAAGMLLATLIIHVAYTVFIFADLRIKGLIKLRISSRMVKESLKYSVPIMPHNLSSYIATLVSRVLLNGFFGTATVGLFSVASQFGIVVDTIESSSNNALTPWFFDYKNRSDGNTSTIRSLTKAFVVFFGFCLLGLGLFSKEIIIILTSEDYLNAWKVIPVIVIAYCVKAIYYFYLNVLLYFKAASKKLFIGTVVGNLLNVVVAAIMTPSLGMYGPAIALIAAQLFIAVYVYKVSVKYDRDSFLFKQILFPLIIALVLMVIGDIPSYIFFSAHLSIVDFAIKVVLLIAYMAYCYFTNKNEIHMLIIKLRNRKS